MYKWFYLVLLFCTIQNGFGQTITFNKSIDVNQNAEGAESLFVVDDSTYLLYGGYLDVSLWWQGMFVIKTNAWGDTLWTRHHLDTLNYFFSGLHGTCIASSDGDYVHGSSLRALGAENGDYLIGKFNGEGAILWQTMVGTPELDQGLRAIETADGGYTILGASGSGDNKDAYVVKVNSEGEILWEQFYGGDLFDATTSALKTEDNGLLIAMSSDSYGINGGRAIVFIKTNSLGEIEWEEVLYPEISGGGADIAIDSLGGYLLSGTFNTPPIVGNYQYPRHLTRLDSNFEEIWQRVYSEAYFKYIAGYRVLSDNRIIVYGWYDSPDIFNATHSWMELLNLEDGGVIWSKEGYYFSSNSLNTIKDVKPTPDGGFIATGDCTNPEAEVNENVNTWLLKVDCQGNWEQPLDSTCLPQVPLPIVNDTTITDTVGLFYTNPQAYSLYLFPNPAQEILTVQVNGWSWESGFSIAVHDVWGRLVEETPLLKSPHQVEVSDWAAGVYILSLYKNSVLLDREKIIKP